MITLHTWGPGGLYAGSVEVDPLGPTPSQSTTLAPPETTGQEVAQWDGVAWVKLDEAPEIPPPAVAVPAKVHKFWLIKVLEGLGQMDAIEDAMDAAWEAGNRSLKRDWQAATEIERANQLLNEFAAERGFTAADLDNMFVQAAAYQAAA